jgi:poly(hydroxyalkanoate) depolymerase family esterase
MIRFYPLLLAGCLIGQGSFKDDPPGATPDAGGGGTSPTATSTSTTPPGNDSGAPTVDSGIPTPDGGTVKEPTCSKVTGSFVGLEMHKCVPAGMDGKTAAPAPLVIALHGYTQSAEELKNTSEWHKLGARHGFYVVFVQALGNRSFYWYTSGRARGQSDPAAIVAMVDKMKADHNIDEGKVFVTGMSAGGYMAIALLAGYPDVFAAGASFSGGPYGCDTNCPKTPTGSSQTVFQAFPSWWMDATKRKPRLILFHGDLDGVVTPGNMQAAATQWLGALGADTTPDNASLGLPTSLKGYPYQAFAKNNVSVVETVKMTDLGHGTPVEPGSAPDQGGHDPKPSKTMENNPNIAQDWTNTGSVYGPYYAARFFGIAK